LGLFRAANFLQVLRSRGDLLCHRHPAVALYLLMGWLAVVDSAAATAAIAAFLAVVYALTKVVKTAGKS